jgi:hypothetical protein
LAAAERPGARAVPPAKEATFDNAFAVLGAGTVRDGRKYAPFYEHVIGPHAVVDRGTVFCAFQNCKGQPVVMSYQSGKKQWTGPVIASQFGLGRDDHGNPSICIDGQGHLHVFYGCHGGPMRHARSAAPYDISRWEEQEPPTPRATYPQTMRMADGSLLLFYRAGGHVEPWSLRISRDDGRSWSKSERVIEMRLDPPDRLAAAYCDFFPASDARTVHCFWNHKDDNAARVTDERPHPWRPLKYKGLHEAVYRYNVYYAHRDAEGVWRNAAGEAVKLPISKKEADTRCPVYDSGDEFAMLGGTRLAVDRENRPYIRFGTGVVDWVRLHKDPSAVIVPVTPRFARFDSGRWQVSRTMPGDWPADVARILAAPGVLAHGDEWPGGHWFIFAVRQAIKPGYGCAVLLYNDETGYAVRNAGPALVD